MDLPKGDMVSKGSGLSHSVSMPALVLLDAAKERYGSRKAVSDLTVPHPHAAASSLFGYIGSMQARLGLAGGAWPTGAVPATGAWAGQGPVVAAAARLVAAAVAAAAGQQEQEGGAASPKLLVGSEALNEETEMILEAYKKLAMAGVASPMPRDPRSPNGGVAPPMALTGKVADLLPDPEVQFELDWARWAGWGVLPA